MCSDLMAEDWRAVMDARAARRFEAMRRAAFLAQLQASTRAAQVARRRRGRAA